MKWLFALVPFILGVIGCSTSPAGSSSSTSNGITASGSSSTGGTNRATSSATSAGTSSSDAGRSASASSGGASSSSGTSTGTTTGGHPCSGTPLFCDDFTNASLASDYTTFNGVWTRTVTPPQYAVVDPNAWERARATLADDESDFDLTIQGHTEGDYGFGLIYGASANQSDGYAVLVHPAQFQGIYLKRLNPDAGDTDIASTALPSGLAGTPMTLRVQRQAGMVTAWLNSQQLLQSPDDAGALDGRLGLLLSATDNTDGGGAVFDLFRIDTATLADAGTTIVDAGPDAGPPDAGGAPPIDAGTCTILGAIVAAADWDSFVSALGQTPTANSWYVDYTHPLSDWVSDEQWELSQWTGSPWQGDTLILGVPLVLQGDDADTDFQTIADGGWDSVLDGVFGVWAGAGYTDFFIRLDWEFNGNWMIWAVTPQNLPDFLAASQHVAQLAHDFIGATIHVVWNPNICNSAFSYCTSLPYASYYYGDAYVDTVSLDVYGEPAGDDTTDAGSIGPSDFEVTTALQFAQAHGKPFAISETGAMDTTFPTNLAATIVASGVPVQYMSIWDIDNSSGNLLWSYTPSLEAAWKAAFDSIQQASCAGQ